MPMDITRTAPWQALLAHREQLRPHHLRELFAREPARFEKLSFRLGDFLADFSKQRITPETLGLLTDLARAADVEGWRDRMFAGERINVSEQRAVLHPALRFLGTGPFYIPANLSGQAPEFADKIPYAGHHFSQETGLGGVSNYFPTAHTLGGGSMVNGGALTWPPDADISGFGDSHIRPACR